MKWLFLMCLLFISISQLVAQPDGWSDDPYDTQYSEDIEETNSTTDADYDWSWKGIPTAPPPPPTPVPIDGGIGFLFVAGSAYGLKRLMGKK